MLGLLGGRGGFQNLKLHQLLVCNPSGLQYMATGTDSVQDLSEAALSLRMLLHSKTLKYGLSRRPSILRKASATMTMVLLAIGP